MLNLLTMSHVLGVLFHLKDSALASLTQLSEEAIFLEVLAADDPLVHFSDPLAHFNVYLLQIVSLLALGTPALILSILVSPKRLRGVSLALFLRGTIKPEFMGKPVAQHLEAYLEACTLSCH